MKRGSGHRFLWAALLTAVPLPVIGWLLGQNWFTVALVVGVLPLADAVMGKDFGNPAEEPHPASDHSNLLRWNLYAYVPVQLAMIAWGAAVFAGGSLSDGQALGLLLSVGLVTGGQGITVAHELGHRRSRTDRSLARLLLVTVCYGHFHIEHNRGHHARVATPDDPSTARFGETLYAFLPRALWGSLRSAWRLEAARLGRRGRPLFGPHNQMLWFAAAPVLIGAALFALWGGVALLFFAGQAVVACVLLEAINYVEHYGLVRAVSNAGRLERVDARHSWNASERLSNACLFNLQRHADHHANPNRPYPLLRDDPASPQLPTGYPGMLLLALWPPLWFRIMNPRVQRWRSAPVPTTSGAAGA